MGKNSMTTDVNLPGGIAIFGGTGFIGRHLINCMSLKQNTLIRVFTRNTRMVSNFSNGNIKYIDGNLDSFDDIYNFVAGQKVVINLAYIDGDHELPLVLRGFYILVLRL
jgi:nucleoside-diphosphate-sugar epimerase